MRNPDFVHLHVHSEYSLLDGANRITDMVQACLDDGQGALALTDHGNMFGVIELYKKCKSAGIKPILGCEVYIARDGRLQPSHKERNPTHHLTLLARDQEGYRNLLKLTSASYLEGFHYRPRIDKELLSQHSRGLSCLSGCLSGEISELLKRGRTERAADVASELRDLFGPQHFWLELQRNGLEVQDRVNDSLIDISRSTGIPLVATNDIHYLRHEDCAAQDVLLCINTGAKRSDEKRFRMDTKTLFFRTREEMGHLFRDVPESLTATMDVAEQIGLDVEFGNYHLPVFTPDTDESPDELFDRLCEEGLRKHFPQADAKPRERLEQEKRVIREMGFVSYFLIVWDLIRWARENDIPVGPGRGSAAGSIIAYVLKITRVDPLKYDLLFERFLNSARISMPDIDIDFCKEGRERVLEYTRLRYGEENVAQIGTFATLASRSVVRDVGRVLEIPLGEIDRLTKVIPQGPGTPPLHEALRTDRDLIEAASNERYGELFEFSKKLDGLTRHISTHAAGVVIADRPIVEYVPLCTTKEDTVTQFPGPTLEDLGLLKMDYLGLRTLTIIERALGNIRRSGRPVPDMENLPLDDAETFRLLNQGDTLGVFQLESDGMRKLLTRLRPDCFEDLIAVLALYRPGPLESGMAEMFIRRKHGQEKIDYPHESVEEILRDTYGCIVYQEQVMLISNALANFSLNEADNLRKAMGKKKPEIMEKFSEKFVEGATANGCGEGMAREIWQNIVKFGGYGFNKSHSTAYALITWHTAYLKAHHRVEFLAANMSCEMQDSDKIKDFADDARTAKITLLPPDIRRSEWEFMPEDAGIRFGFGAIKGTGKKAIEALCEVREQLSRSSRSLDLVTLCGEAGPTRVTRTSWEALIRAGCFDHEGHNRGSVLAALDAAMTDGARLADDRRSGQGNLFGGEVFEEEAPAPIDDTHALGTAETLKMEREVLGFYLTGHPLEERAGLFRLLSTTDTRHLQSLPGGAEVSVGGLVVGLKTSTTRTGKRMARFRLEDLEGGVNVTCFPRAYEANKEILVDDAVIVCRAKLEERATEDSANPVGLLLEEVLEVDQAVRRFEGAMIIRLTPEDQERLDDLAALLEAHRGSSRLFFEVEGADGRRRRIRTAERHRLGVSPELVNEIELLLGRDRALIARV